MDIFACCKTLLHPPSEMSFEQYDSTWEKGGSKVHYVVFNSYPGYVSLVPETPAATKKYLMTKEDRPAAVASMKCFQKDENNPNNTYFIDGMNQLASVADSFSMHDVIQYLDEDMSDMIMRLTLKVNMQDVFATNTKSPKLDISTRMPDTRRPVCLSKCLIDKRMMEKLCMVNMVHNMIALKKIRNFDYVPAQEYNLSDHVGKFYSKWDEKKNVWMIQELYAEDKKLSKKRKLAAVQHTPVLECINIFSRKYTDLPLDSFDQVAVSTKSHARVKVGNKFIQRKGK